MGAGIWSVNFVVLQGSTAGTLSQVIVVHDPSTDGFTMSVGVGPLYDTANGYAEYDITSNYGGQSDSGTGSVEVTDAGATATLHASGTTADGVALDAMISCPTVTRG